MPEETAAHVSALHHHHHYTMLSHRLAFHMCRSLLSGVVTWAPVTCTHASATNAFKETSRLEPSTAKGTESSTGEIASDGLTLDSATGDLPKPAACRGHSPHRCVRSQPASRHPPHPDARRTVLHPASKPNQRLMPNGRAAQVLNLHAKNVGSKIATQSRSTTRACPCVQHQSSWGPFGSLHHPQGDTDHMQCSPATIRGEPAAAPARELQKALPSLRAARSSDAARCKPSDLGMLCFWFIPRFFPWRCVPLKRHHACHNTTRCGAPAHGAPAWLQMMRRFHALWGAFLGGGASTWWGACGRPLPAWACTLPWLQMMRWRAP